MKDVTNDTFKYMSTLGEGAYGRVLKLEEKSTGKIYAAKVLIPNKKGKYNKNESKALINEKEISQYLYNETMPARSRQFLLRPYNVGKVDFTYKKVKNYDGPMHLMEYVKGDTVYNHLYEWMHKYKKTGKAPDGFMKCIIRIRVCIFDLWRAGVIHGDLHLNNIMADERGNIKLFDFGLAQKTRKPFKPEKTSIHYVMWSTHGRNSESEIGRWWTGEYERWKKITGFTSNPNVYIFNGISRRKEFYAIHHWERWMEADGLFLDLYMPNNATRSSGKNNKFAAAFKLSNRSQRDSPNTPRVFVPADKIKKLDSVARNNILKRLSALRKKNPGRVTKRRRAQESAKKRFELEMAAIMKKYESINLKKQALAKASRVEKMAKVRAALIAKAKDNITQMKLPELREIAKKIPGYGAAMRKPEVIALIRKHRGIPAPKLSPLRTTAQLKEMKLVELRPYAKKRQVKIPAGARKLDIIKKIREKK